MAEDGTRRPVAVRAVDTPAALALADLAAVFDDVQAVLRCCERLVEELPRDADGILVEALWTTALLSYARCFAPGERGAGLTDDDITRLGLQGEVLEWHRVLLRLAARAADPSVNPRESFTVGIAQGADGAAAGVAVTSASRAPLDDVTVRQTGAIAHGLLRAVDGQITAQQEVVLAAARALPRRELERLPLLDVQIADDGPAAPALSDS